MRQHFVLSLLVSMILVIASLALLPVGVQAHEEEDEDELVGTFDWLLGDDLDLLLFGVIFFGPAAAVDEDGNRIEISGSGTFTLGDDDDDEESVTGGGTYRIFDASGNLIAEGEWEMTEFEDFEDFGGFFVPGLGFFRGGVLEAEIELDGLGEGEIVINCNVNAPPGHPLIEGMTVEIEDLDLDDEDLDLDDEDLDFDEALPPAEAPGGGGITLFIGP